MEIEWSNRHRPVINNPPSVDDRSQYFPCRAQEESLVLLHSS